MGSRTVFLSQRVFFYLRRAGEVRRYFLFFWQKVERKITKMQKANTDIRQSIKAAGLKNWQIADALNISENTLYRRMRHELAAWEKQQILEIIQELKGVPAP